MKLLIVSHTAHYRRGGTIAGWGSTVREIDHLATLFDHVVHIAMLHPGPAPESAIPYEAANVRLAPVPPTGGEGLGAKLRILAAVPGFARLFLRELKQADVVHVRCPSSVGLVAVVLLAFVRRPEIRWAKYAGNWNPEEREPFSYTVQRWWLRNRLHRGIVTINGRWPDQPDYIHSFINPCLTDREVAEGRQAGSAKQMSSPIRMLYVGRVEEEKGAGRAIEVLGRMMDAGTSATLDLVGDGPERARIERRAAERGVADAATFHGWLPRPAIDPLYARSHIMLFPTRASEGWPKVLTEAMAYGVIPVCGNVSSIPQFLEAFAVGCALAPRDVDGMVAAIGRYAADPAMWREEAGRAMCAAERFSYTHYLDAVRETVMGERAAVTG